MMNKRIRSMIDEIFSEMKMTADNLALRDELMANAQARYEDAMAQGKTEDAAFAEVAASLEDVQGLLHEMNTQPEPKAKEETSATIELHIESDEENDAHGEEDEEHEAKGEGLALDLDLGETLNKAFSALGDFGKSIMPQARKLARQMDDATGGALKNVGKAVNKGMKDAQKAAGDAIDKMSDQAGELVFDFGKRTDADKACDEDVDDEVSNLHDEASDLRDEASDLRDEASDLRDEALDIRAEAGLKVVTGDQAGAGELRAKADALEAKADELCAQANELDAQADALDTQADALEQAQAMKAAQQAAAEEVREDSAPQEPEQQDAPELEIKHESVLDADGDVNEDAFAKVVEQIQKDAKKIIGDAQDMLRDAVNPAQEADYTVTAGEQGANGSRLFPAAGLRTVDIQLDADDVKIELAQGDMAEVIWTARKVEGQPEIWMEGHTLRIRRKNPDVFKTFFSVFSKEGGQVTVRVPRGYAADYKISTTSGDIHIDEVDADNVKASSTSGDIRLEPDASTRAEEIEANTVSGNVTISACAIDVKAETVSGRQFISCDANLVDVDTVSGKMHIEGACEEFKVNSVSGEAELLCTVVPTKKIDINTVSGTARVALPGEIRGFAAKLSSMSGKVVNEFGPNQYGTCALPIQMNSMSGSLMITRL